MQIKGKNACKFTQILIFVTSQIYLFLKFLLIIKYLRTSLIRRSCVCYAVIISYNMSATET